MPSHIKAPSRTLTLTSAGKYNLYTTGVSESVKDRACIHGRKFETLLRYYLCDGRPVPKFVYREWQTTYKDQPECGSSANRRPELVLHQGAQPQAVLLPGRLLRLAVRNVHAVPDRNRQNEVRPDCQARGRRLRPRPHGPLRVPGKPLAAALQLLRRRWQVPDLVGAGNRRIKLKMKLAINRFLYEGFKPDYSNE